MSVDKMKESFDAMGKGFSDKGIPKSDFQEAPCINGLAEGETKAEKETLQLKEHKTS